MTGNKQPNDNSRSKGQGTISSRKKNVSFSPGAAMLGLATLAAVIPANANPTDRNRAITVSLETSRPGTTPRMGANSMPAIPKASQSALNWFRSQKTQARRPQNSASKPIVVNRPHPKHGTQQNVPMDWQDCFFLYCDPYNLARVENSTVNSQATTLLQPLAGMPYAATGLLHVATTTASIFDKVCNAALIGRGIIVTAANCVAKVGGGDNGLAKATRFIPANTGKTLSSGPYGAWSGSAITVPAAYVNGEDDCIDMTNKRGCLNDLAVILLAKQNNKYPSDVSQISYYNYGEFGYGCRFGWNCTLTQLGYAKTHDNGERMQRLEFIPQKRDFTSNGFVAIGGSPLGRGSEGSPLIVNFGTAPKLTGGRAGKEPVRNVITGISAWNNIVGNDPLVMMTLFHRNFLYGESSYSSDGINYGPGNIGFLVNEVCRSNGPAALRGKPKGACLTAN